MKSDKLRKIVLKIAKKYDKLLKGIGGLKNDYNF
jgi:hypothetical protein